MNWEKVKFSKKPWILKIKIARDKFSKAISKIIFLDSILRMANNDCSHEKEYFSQFEFKILIFIFKKKRLA